MIDERRRLFPRGLSQAKGCHFAADTLLLASFCHQLLPDKPVYCAELGCGCAAALCGLALLRHNLLGVGFEKESLHIEAAQRNLQDLELSEQLHIVQSDLAEKERIQTYARQFRAVLANPPYFTSSEGRPARSPLRNRAERNDNALTLFTACAATLLQHHGFFFCIYPAYKLQELTVVLAKHHLALRKLLPVTSFSTSSCTRLLICACKDAANHCDILPPLVLHSSQGTQKFSAEALNFCPWLGAGHQTSEQCHDLSC